MAQREWRHVWRRLKKSWLNSSETVKKEADWMESVSVKRSPVGFGLR
jgi:hypothetical protein